MFPSSSSSLFSSLFPLSLLLSLSSISFFFVLVFFNSSIPTNYEANRYTRGGGHVALVAPAWLYHELDVSMAASREPPSFSPSFSFPFSLLICFFLLVSFFTNNPLLSFAQLDPLSLFLSLSRR